MFQLVLPFIGLGIVGILNTTTVIFVAQYLGGGGGKLMIIENILQVNFF